MRFQIVGIGNHAKTRVRTGLRLSDINIYQTYMMDVIFIRDLVMEATVGIRDHERSWPQSIQLNLDVAMPGSNACSSDKIGDTIDYSAVVESIRRAVALRRFNLLEALAECVARVVLDCFGASWVRVEVAKGRVVPGVRQVGILIERVGTVGTVNAFGQHEVIDELQEIDWTTD